MVLMRLYLLLMMNLVLLPLMNPLSRSRHSGPWELPQVEVGPCCVALKATCRRASSDAVAQLPQSLEGPHCDSERSTAPLEIRGRQ